LTVTEPLECYAGQSAISDPGRHASAFESLPADVPGLCAVVQGLLVHPFWAPVYGWTIAKEREEDLQLRLVSLILGRILDLDGRPLSETRLPEARFVGNCRDYTVLFCSMLRHQGVPARARCGFGGYFLPGKFEDHWVAEYWNTAEERWQLVDAQLDARQREVLRLDFDPCDVPRDKFVVAGKAWQVCRAGEADPEAFGLTALNEHGLWWVRDNLVRDVAALNKVELLPWDSWGLAQGPEYVSTEADTALLDRAAELSQRPTAFAELRGIYEDGDDFRVPGTIRSQGSGGGRLVEIPVGAV
jgi:hypothetical protein